MKFSHKNTHSQYVAHTSKGQFDEACCLNPSGVLFVCRTAV